jgi:hypothetical protein
MGNAYKILVGKPDGKRGHLEYLMVSEKFSFYLLGKKGELA